MKKTLFLTLAIMALFVCLLAISVSAAGQSYTTFDVTLTDGTEKTAYSPDCDPWEGRILLGAKLYAQAPLDTEGTYEEIDWTTVKEIDFSSSMIYWYKDGKHNEQAYGTNQGGTALCIYPNGIDKKNQLTSLEKVTTGKAVTLREGAFNGAPALKTLVISSSLKYMQNNVFYNCTSLETIIFEENSNFESLNDTFLGCTSLKSVSFPASLKSVGGNAFYGCTALETVTFAEGGSYVIQNSSFCGCTSLKNLTLTEGLTSIGSSAFKECDSLVSVKIPDSVTNLGGAFGYCDNLEELVISDNSQISNKLIGILEYSPKIKSVRIPPLVTELGYDNFRGCSSLSEIIWPNNLLTISGAQNFNNTGLTSITFPNSLTYLAGGNLSGCNSLEEVRFGASLTNLGDGILTLRSLKRAYIPATITSVGTHLLGYSNPADSSTNITFIFTGTKEQAEAVRALALAATEGTNHQPNASKFYDAELVSASEYDVTQEPVGYHFVYDYVLCDAFYGGMHTMTGDVEMQFNGYTKDITFVDTCTRNGCGFEGVDSSKTIGAIFQCLGYSYTESALGGKYSMAQFFGVNEENLEKYENEIGTNLTFGVIAKANVVEADQIVGAISPSLDGERVLYKDFTNGKHNYFEIKVSNITTELKDTKIVFCAYVIENGKMSYLNNNQTVEELTGESYNDVVAIKSAE